MHIFIIDIVSTYIILAGRQPEVALFEIVIVLCVCYQYPSSDIKLSPCVQGWSLYVPKGRFSGSGFLGGILYFCIKNIPDFITASLVPVLLSEF